MLCFFIMKQKSVLTEHSWKYATKMVKVWIYDTFTSEEAIFKGLKTLNYFILLVFYF